MTPLQQAVQVMVGERLTVVSFTLDGWHLGFEDSNFTIYSSIRVRFGEQSVRDGAEGFRDVLCGLIGERVESVFLADSGLAIHFENNRIIELSSREEDLQGPEAFMFESVTVEATYVV